jgi:hypothetical protein
MKVMRATAAARVAVGLGMLLGAKPFLKAILRDEQASPAFVLFARTIGIRDTVFGLGCLISSARGKHPDGTRRWVQLWLVSEIADVLVGAASKRDLGVARAAQAVAAPLPFIASDVWVLRRLETRSA